MAANKTFGTAKEFFRARVISIEEVLPSPFEWREDVLYESSGDPQPQISKEYKLQILSTEGDRVHTLRTYRDRNRAEKLYRRLEEDLHRLTKQQFEDKYVGAAEDAPLTPEL